MEEVAAESKQHGGHCEVWGVSQDELRTLLAERFPERHCSVAEVSPDAPLDSVVASLRAEIETKNLHIDDLLLKTAASGASIHAFHSQQKQLFDEFCLLRQRYDDQKANLLDALWIKCGTYHPELKHIPALDEDLVANESDELIGKYSIGQHLGEGQFATVKLCWLTDTENGDNGSSGDKEWALKIIKKERLTSFSSLRRVSNEIDILQTLQSKFVVKLEGAIQSNTKLYIVTEKGGSDLFEFFDEHPEGVPEPWAKEITTCILQGILYCHQQGICHRDLKPENILLRFDYETEKCVDLKLCDFGLSVKFTSSELLTDFCGSPGFFAPEMIVHGSYFGDKADVWSTGCILLELILGHERFCDAWMSAYDFDVLQDKERFDDMIKTTVRGLPDALEFPKDLRDFVMQFLRIRSSERPDILHICNHPWVAEDMQKALGALAGPLLQLQQQTAMNVDQGEEGDHPAPPLIVPDSPSQHTLVNHSRHAFRAGSVNITIVKAVGASFSERERRMVEDHNSHVQQAEAKGLLETASSANDTSTAAILDAIAAVDLSIHPKEAHHTTIHLPPIEPQTPSVGKFRKILKKAEEALPQGEKDEWMRIEEETKTSTTLSRLNIERHHDAPVQDDDPALLLQLSPRQAANLLSKGRLSPRQAQLVSSSSDSKLVSAP